MSNNKILIIGAGPTGLGAAYRLKELGHKNWAIFERNEYVGGLAASFVDPQGFTWDIGCHVLHSHYSYCDALVERVLAGEYCEHQREAWIRLKSRWIPYPFQNNIRHLPPEDVHACLVGLAQVYYNHTEPQTAPNFAEWALRVFGKGITELFMLPYNFKVWAVPPTMLGKQWIADRVSVVDFERVLRNVVLQVDNVGWGPNNTFKFPRRGGTGQIYKGIQKYMGAHLELNKELTEVDLKKRVASFSDGATHTYDHLISTIPLNQLVSIAYPVPRYVVDASQNLMHNSVYVVGIGIKRECPSTKCWMYFPEDKAPFYRVTYFSNYSPHNCPGPGYYSLMCEISTSAFKPEDSSTIVERTIAGLIDVGLIEPDETQDIVSRHLIYADYGYPIPTLGRDEALRTIQTFLADHRVYSRGRFGAWKYEAGNMDHSVMQGVEIVDRLLLGKAEPTWTL
jgi:protoporphyrinogen oxidase